MRRAFSSHADRVQRLYNNLCNALLIRIILSGKIHLNPLFSQIALSGELVGPWCRDVLIGGQWQAEGMLSAQLSCLLRLLPLRWVSCKLELSFPSSITKLLRYSDFSSSVWVQCWGGGCFVTHGCSELLPAQFSRQCYVCVLCPTKCL